MSINFVIKSLSPERASQKKKSFAAEMMARVDCIIFVYLGDGE